jgi:Family of unknown function (DUF6496)
MKRRKLSKHMTYKIHKTMGEFNAGTLKSGSGQKVTSRAQALAIGYSEGRKHA